MTNSAPLIAIVGRVNVGKSTLFNTFISQRKALVSKIPGTTRDLNFGLTDWRGKKFKVVDTGGIFETKIKKPSQQSAEMSVEESLLDLNLQVEKKARQIIGQASLILFILDTKEGLTEKDRLIAQWLKKNKIPVIVVANKCDNQVLWLEAEQFQKLGLGEVMPIAATSGKGVGDLLEKIIKKTKGKHSNILTSKHFNIGTEEQKNRRTEEKENIETDKIEIKKQTQLTNRAIRVCIIGKPNVGKSSLLNQILGEEKVIVSAIPHTTREPNDFEIEYQGQKILLIDTAGIRRKNKVDQESLEGMGISMSIKVLKKADVALFLLDISEELTAQDAQLAGLIIQAGVNIVLVANKYDLIQDKETNTTQKISNYIAGSFPFLSWAPIIFTSALSGKNCQKILQLILRSFEARKQKISQKDLDEFNAYLIRKMPPPRQSRKQGSDRKSRAYIAKIRQKDFCPPVFEVKVTNMANLPASYLNYLSNHLRSKFNFVGTPIKIVVARGK